jgi:chemotaxis protein CheC
MRGANMDDINTINEMHFDILREIGNIGSGNAVSALALMLNKKIDMRVPSVKLLEFKDIADFIGGGETLIIGILVGISGDINGIMMFIVKKDSARKLTNYLFNDKVDANQEFNEMELSALTEIGNILASSYIGSLSTLINKKVLPSVPYIAIDMANAIFSVPATEFGKHSDRVLFIESVFNAEEDDVSGYFLLVPDMPSFKLILSSLGVE